MNGGRVQRKTLTTILISDIPVRFLVKSEASTEHRKEGEGDFFFFLFNANTKIPCIPHRVAA